MKEIVSKIIKEEIPSEVIFDSHSIISWMLQNQSADYLSKNKNQNTASHNGSIAMAIASLENDGVIKKVGTSWSKNIHDKYSTCECWIKL